MHSQLQVLASNMGEGHLYDGLFGGQQMSQVDFKTEIGGVAHGSRWLIGPQSPLHVLMASGNTWSV